MTSVVRRHPSAFFLASALAVAATCAAVVRSPAFVRNPDVASWGVTFDLAISVPLLYWLFVVRTGRARALTIAPVFLAGTLAASTLLPHAQQHFVRQLSSVIGPVAEVLLVVALIRRVRAARHEQRTSNDAYSRIQFAARTLAGEGRIADAIASEGAMFYFAFAGWWKAPDEREGTTLTFHERNGWGTIVACILVLLAAEGIGMHLLLGIWSAKAAWTWTALDLWAAIWLIGDYHALRVRRSWIDDEALHLRYGLRWTATVPLHAIESVTEIRDESEWKKPGVLKVAILDSPRWLVTLAEPLTAQGLMGITRTVRAIALLPDDDSAMRRCAGS